MKRFTALLTVLAALAACNEPGASPERITAATTATASSSLPHINRTNIPIPVSLNATFTAEQCANHPGPRITLEGVAAVGGFGVEMTFTSNLKGTHTYPADNVVDVSFQNSGGPIVIPKQPSRGGTGGNPFIWVQFVDAKGNPTSDEIFLGRCVQGTRYGFNRGQGTSGAGFAQFEITSCENSPGPFIDVTAGLTMDGLGLRIIFRNNDNPVGGPHEAATHLLVASPLHRRQIPRHLLVFVLLNLRQLGAARALCIEELAQAVLVGCDARLHLIVDGATPVHLLLLQRAAARAEALL